MKKLFLLFALFLSLAASGRATLHCYGEFISATASANDSSGNANDLNQIGSGGFLNSGEAPTGIYQFTTFLFSYFRNLANAFIPSIANQTQFRERVWFNTNDGADLGPQFFFSYAYYDGINTYDQCYATYNYLGSHIAEIKFQTNDGAAVLTYSTFDITGHNSDWFELEFDFDNGVRKIVYLGYMTPDHVFHSDGSTLATDDISGSHTSTGDCNQGFALGADHDNNNRFNSQMNGVQFFSNATYTDTPTNTPTPLPTDTPTPWPTPNGTLPRLQSVIGGQAQDWNLYYLDPADGTVVAARVLHPPTGNILNFNAMARRPTTGVLYVVYATVEAPTTRQLATVNEATGNLTIVHSVGNVGGLAFDTAGNGWATQKAAGPSAPITLHKYNVTSWSDQNKGDVTPSDYNAGQSLAYSPNDGLLYFSYNNSSAPNFAASLETIELTGFTTTELGEIQGAINSQLPGHPEYLGCLAWNPVDSNLFFMSQIPSSVGVNDVYFSVSTTAASSSFIGYGCSLQYQKGLVYLPATTPCANSEWKGNSADGQFYNSVCGIDTLTLEGIAIDNPSTSSPPEGDRWLGYLEHDAADVQAFLVPFAGWPSSNGGTVSFYVKGNSSFGFYAIAFDNSSNRYFYIYKNSDDTGPGTTWIDWSDVDGNDIELPITQDLGDGSTHLVEISWNSAGQIQTKVDSVIDPGASAEGQSFAFGDAAPFAGFHEIATNRNSAGQGGFFWIDDVIINQTPLDTFTLTPTPPAGTATSTPTASPTPSATQTFTPTPSRTASPTSTASPTPTATPTQTPNLTPVPPLGPAPKPMYEINRRRWGAFGGWLP